jgi:hypothetical protein
MCVVLMEETNSSVTMNFTSCIGHLILMWLIYLELDLPLNGFYAAPIKEEDTPPVKEKLDPVGESTPDTTSMNVWLHYSHTT